ncbi:hypothetical protein B5K11_09025 [Rhizobium leguminosarum bv. trifolii]|uniref:hypothetical protein n=1 Tax=Rhizobium leguminosarum TaxID=384 RepID=UPI000E2F2AA1|nr:hypothetical protein [Rhizobium leguminosarum]RFB95107.1 hypothetical protein B5K11_09025 [Rhizobium leguminosarum bv. trifolii]
MADIDAKALAFSAARSRILELQEQMTDKVLLMAAEVEKMMAIVPASEANAFLKARCNLPSTELSTYVGPGDEGARRGQRRCSEGDPQTDGDRRSDRHEGRRRDPREACGGKVDGSRGVDGGEPEDRGGGRAQACEAG